MKKYRQLEKFNPDSIRMIAELLVPFGKGIAVLAETRAETADDSPATRKTEILQFIKKRIPGNPSLGELAAKIHLSPSRTCHLVKEIFGISFSKLLNRERLIIAKSLLRSTDSPISGISRSVGISSEYHFSRIFKKAFGMPPGKYRGNVNRSLEN